MLQANIFPASEVTSKLSHSDAVMLAQGPTLAFNPHFVTGVSCWGGTGEHIVPPTVKKPRRQKLSRHRKETLQATQAYLWGITLRKCICGLIHSSDSQGDTCTCSHICNISQGYWLGNTQSERCSRTEDTCESETDKLLNDCSQVCVSPRTVMLLCQTMHECNLPFKFLRSMMTHLLSSEGGITEKRLFFVVNTMLLIKMNYLTFSF